MLRAFTPDCLNCDSCDLNDSVDFNYFDHKNLTKLPSVLTMESSTRRITGGAVNVSVTCNRAWCHNSAKLTGGAGGDCLVFSIAIFSRLFSVRLIQGQDLHRQ
jgi:hypothetical protein